MNENQYNVMNNNNLNNYEQQNNQMTNLNSNVQQVNQPVQNTEEPKKKNNSELKTFVIMIMIIFIAVMFYPNIYDFIKNIRFN